MVYHYNDVLALLLAQIHGWLVGIYNTSWKVLLGTVKPLLVKQDNLVQKKTPATVKRFKVILDDVFL